MVIMGMVANKVDDSKHYDGDFAVQDNDGASDLE